MQAIAFWEARSASREKTPRNRAKTPSVGGIINAFSVSAKCP